MDILLEVSFLSQFQALPRQGHFEQAYHIFVFLKRRPKLTLHFDPTRAKIDESISMEGSRPSDFKDIYCDAKQEIPQNAPKPKGSAVKIVVFVYASHVANKMTRRCYIDLVIFINRAPSICYNKGQNTDESSTFSSEFIAMKVCMEHILSLRYKF